MHVFRLLDHDDDLVAELAHRHEGYGELSVVKVDQLVVDGQLCPDRLGEMDAQLSARKAAQKGKRSSAFLCGNVC